MNLNRQKGMAQLFVVAIMAFLALGLPLTTKLVQQKQENRSQAQSVDSQKTNDVDDRAKAWITENSKPSNQNQAEIGVRYICDGNWSEKWLGTTQQGNGINCTLGCNKNDGRCYEGYRCEIGTLTGWNMNGDSWYSNYYDKDNNKSQVTRCGSNNGVGRCEEGKCVVVDNPGVEYKCKFITNEVWSAWLDGRGVEVTSEKCPCATCCDSKSGKCTKNNDTTPSPTPRPVCTSGTKQCSGNALQECISSSWKLVENCKYGCDVGKKTCKSSPSVSIPKPICSSEEGFCSSLSCTNGVLYTPGQSNCGGQFCCKSTKSITTPTKVPPLTANTDAVCGTAHGQKTNTEPTTNLCKIGTVGTKPYATFNDEEASYSWTCNGTGTGKRAACYTLRPTPIPVCGLGAMKCSGNSLLVCRNNTWQVATNCSYGCVNGGCKTAPTPTRIPTRIPTRVPTRVPTPRPISVNGRCGSTRNSCISGSFSDLADSSISYLWKCMGKNGGTSVSCSLRKPSSGYTR